MRKFAIAATAAALIAALTAASQAQPPPVHDAGLRIIHVPQGRAATEAYPDGTAIVEEEPPPKPRKRTAPRRVLPPADAKRTVLSAPADDRALTPIRPTPRWRGIEKFSEPPKPITSKAPPEPVPIPDDTPPPAD